MESKPDGANHQVVTQLMFIDAKTLSAMQFLADNLWEEEMWRFNEATGLQFNPLDPMEQWIGICELRGLTNQTFYHLMIIKQSLFNPF